MIMGAIKLNGWGCDNFMAPDFICSRSLSPPTWHTKREWVSKLFEDVFNLECTNFMPMQTKQCLSGNNWKLYLDEIVKRLKYDEFGRRQSD